MEERYVNEPPPRSPRHRLRGATLAALLPLCAVLGATSCGGGGTTGGGGATSSSGTGSTTTTTIATGATTSATGSTTSNASSTSTGTSQCVGNQMKCGNTCVDTTIDPANCGGCNMPCDTTAGMVCSSSKCALTCGGGTKKCGTSCVDTNFDPENCGGCNMPCNTAGGEVCSGGMCTLSCNGGTEKCGTVCVDTKSDPQNCGGCTMPCNTAGGEVCSGGMCMLTCVGGTQKCGGVCVDTKSDPQNCGGCTMPCDTTGGEICSGGMCALSCGPGTLACNGKCVDPSSSPDFCGATGDCVGTNAGAACASGQFCFNGSCGGTLAASCRQLHLSAPSLPSGMYMIDPDGIGPKPASLVYCDMVTDGGGYTWVQINDPTLAADQTAYQTACANLGMEVVVPRTKAHAISMAAQLGGTLPSLYNIYPNANGAQGIDNWHGTCQGANCTFWMTDDTSFNGAGTGNVQCTGFEPNGDNNTANMIYHYPNGTINDPCGSSVAPGVPGYWNDANNIVGIQGSVVCSTNDYGPANGEAYSGRGNVLQCHSPGLPEPPEWCVLDRSGRSDWG